MTNKKNMNSSPNIKQSVLSVGLGRGGMILLQFVSSIILARLLTPEDYGITAMLAIFISVSGLLVDSGFGGSLVYYKDVDERDYSTVFWLNMIISLGLYLGMFLFSDVIASFYGIAEISLYIKVLGLVVVFNSLGHIQFNLLYKNLEFNKINIVNLASYFIAAVTAICLAYNGFGVWALISQQVLNSVIATTILIGLNRFVPKLFFSWTIIKKHWSFGSGLFFSSILKSIYDNMYLQLMGKYADVKNAGYFNQASKLKDIPSGLFSSTFETSLFPLFSKLEDDGEFSNRFRRVTSFFAFCCCPAFFILALCSDSVIVILLGEKWLEAATLLSILSIGAIFYILETVNRSGLKAKGKSMLIFKMDFLKRSLSIVLMFVALKLWGIYGLAYFYIVNSFISWLINTFCLSRYSAYNIGAQIKDVIKPFVLSLAVAVLVFFVFRNVSMNFYASLIVNTLSFSSVYLVLSIITKVKSLIFIKETLKEKLKK